MGHKRTHKYKYTTPLCCHTPCAYTYTALHATTPEYATTSPMHPHTSMPLMQSNTPMQPLLFMQPHATSPDAATPIMQPHPSMQPPIQPHLIHQKQLKTTLKIKAFALSPRTTFAGGCPWGDSFTFQFHFSSEDSGSGLPSNFEYL